MKKPKIEKVKKSEKDIVLSYADKVIGGKVSRGHVDKRFEFTKKEGTVNKELWLDNDFYFSVVFQSSDQKYQFLDFLAEKLKLEIEKDEQVSIVNGMKFAEALNVPIKKEVANSFPYGNIDLLPLVLDAEALE
jgi:DNA polymerase III epsilon subunit-like protein